MKRSSQLNNPELPKLSNAFLCESLIQERADKFAGAGWAAWACDDAGSDKAAQVG